LVSKGRSRTCCIARGRTCDLKRYGNDDKSPLDRLNSILSEAGLEIRLEANANLGFSAFKGSSGAFSLGALSDGERNAVLLAAECLSAPSETLLLVDEPEKNLYQRITARLIKSLVADRNDCFWVISTHDHRLITGDARQTTVLLLRACNFTDGQASSWEGDIVEDLAALDSEILPEILGPRRKILFVEGTHESVDVSTYSVLMDDDV
jgi:ATPase subunit of ABC transporter with duplicated ATPase domains